MKKEKNNKKKSQKNSYECNLTLLELQEIELLKEQLFGAVLGILAELKFFKASYEEIQEICNKYVDSKEKYINSNKTYLESAQLFLISQLIFTKVSFQFYYLLMKNNIENDTYEDLEPQAKINISCVLNSLGNMYFLDAIQDIRNRENDEPIIGD